MDNNIEMLIEQARKEAFIIGLEIGRKQAFDEVRVEREAKERLDRKSSVKSMRRYGYNALFMSMAVGFPLSEVEIFYKELDAEKALEEKEAKEERERIEKRHEKERLKATT